MKPYRFRFRGDLYEVRGDHACADPYAVAVRIGESISPDEAALADLTRGLPGAQPSDIDEDTGP